MIWRGLPVGLAPGIPGYSRRARRGRPGARTGGSACRVWRLPAESITSALKSPVFNLRQNDARAGAPSTRRFSDTTLATLSGACGAISVAVQVRADVPRPSRRCHSPINALHRSNERSHNPDARCTSRQIRWLRMPGRSRPESRGGGRFARRPHDDRDNGDQVRVADVASESTLLYGLCGSLAL